MLLSLVGENGMAFVPLPPSKENPGVSHSLGLRNGKTRGSRIIGIRVTGNEQERYEEVRCSELRLRRDSGYWYNAAWGAAGEPRKVFPKRGF